MPVKLDLRFRCFADSESGALLGRHALVAWRNKAYVIDTESCKRVHEITNHVSFYQYCRDKALILTEDRVLLLDDSGRLTELRASDIDRGAVRDMAFHVSGFLAVSAYISVAVYSTETGSKIAEVELDAPATGIAFTSSEDGYPVLVAVSAESFP